MDSKANTTTAKATPTHTASERAHLPGIDAPAVKRRGRPRKPRIEAPACVAPANAAPACAPLAREAAPAYRAADGVRSVRHAMPDHERAVIDAALTILGGYLRQPEHTFHTPGAVKQYLQLHLGAEPREVFGVMFLDARNRLLAFEVMFTGTVTQTGVYPREVAKAALQHEATAVILAHNHPSGSLMPSGADEALTKTLKHALALVDVRVMDHVIVSATEAQSMAEMGMV